MPQRIFDVENEKDYADLWDIVPEEIKTIYKDANELPIYYINTPEIDGVIPCPVGLIKINWHDKTEITRPMQEATEQDIGKLCIFWNDTNGLNLPVYKVLFGIKNGLYETFDGGLINTVYTHARRLTKQEIEELC